MSGYLLAFICHICRVLFKVVKAFSHPWKNKFSNLHIITLIMVHVYSAYPIASGALLWKTTAMQLAYMYSIYIIWNTHAHTHMHTRTHACTHTHTHACTHVHSLSHSHTCMHTRTLTHTHTHTHIHTHMHTRTHTYMHGNRWGVKTKRTCVKSWSHMKDKCKTKFQQLSLNKSCEKKGKFWDYFWKKKGLHNVCMLCVCVCVCSSTWMSFFRCGNRVCPWAWRPPLPRYRSVGGHQYRPWPLPWLRVLAFTLTFARITFRITLLFVVF